MKHIIIFLALFVFLVSSAHSADCQTQMADNGTELNVYYQGVKAGVVAVRQDGSWDIWIDGMGALNDVVYTESEAASLVCLNVK